MASIRTQTVTFTLGGGKVASPLEFWEFLKTKYEVKLEELMMVQQETTGRRIFVKFVKKERAEQVAEESEVRMKVKDGECDVMVQGPGQGVKLLRVRNLPCEVSTESVCLCLGQYGKVLEVRDERYPRGSCYQGLLTGTRVVKMFVNRNVPSFVRIGGNEAMIFYQGQKPTCKICNETDHFRVNCPNRRRPPSWANRTEGRKGEEDPEDVADGGPSPSSAPTPTPGTPHRSMPELRGEEEVTEFWQTPLGPQRGERGVSPQQTTSQPDASSEERDVEGEAEPEPGVSTSAEEEKQEVINEEQLDVQQDDDVSTAGTRSRTSTFEFVEGEPVSEAEEALVTGRTTRSRAGSTSSACSMESTKRKRAQDKMDAQINKLSTMLRMEGKVDKAKSALLKKARTDGKGPKSSNGLQNIKF